MNKSLLRTEVTSILNDHVEPGYSLKDILEDLGRHGCGSGMIGALVWYSQTNRFYEEHKEEINQLLSTLLVDCDSNMSNIFGDKWDDEDPLCLEDHNKNLMAWFAFETVAHDIYCELFE